MFDDETINDDEFFNEFDIDDTERINKEIDLIEQDTLEKKRNKKEKDKNYYVTNKELLEEIKKYQESKKKDPDGKRTYIRRTWNNDYENLHKIFTTP